MKFYAETEINAPPEKIWEILTDIERWPEWDPHCEKIEGELQVGNKIKAFSKLSPGRAFPVSVTALEPHRKMIWAGGMPLGLFKGERVFVLAPKGKTTQFSMTENFSGPMLPLIRKSIPDMSQPFADFAQGLKQRAEKPA